MKDQAIPKFFLGTKMPPQLWQNEGAYGKSVSVSSRMAALNQTPVNK
jgi:hypothetical protein